MLILPDLISGVLLFQLKTHCPLSVENALSNKLLDTLCTAQDLLHICILLYSVYFKQRFLSCPMHLFHTNHLGYSVVLTTAQFWKSAVLVKRAYTRERKEERNPFPISYQNPSSLRTKLFLLQAKQLTYSSLQSKKPTLLFHFTMQLVFQFNQSFIGCLRFWWLWSFSHSAFSSILLIAHICCFGVFPATTESQLEICHPQLTSRYHSSMHGHTRDSIFAVCFSMPVSSKQQQREQKHHNIFGIGDCSCYCEN